MILQPLLKQDYVFFNNFMDSVQSHVKNQSYAIVIKRYQLIYFTNKNRKCVFMCKYQNKIKRKLNSQFEIKFRKFRKLNNKRCDCKFKVNVVYK